MKRISSIGLAGLLFCVCSGSGMAAKTSGSFDYADGNRDNVVSREEYAELMSDFYHVLEDPSAHGAPLHKRIARFFKGEKREERPKLSIDKNDYLAQAERHFVRGDTNGDGYLQHSEWMNRNSGLADSGEKAPADLFEGSSLSQAGILAGVAINQIGAVGLHGLSHHSDGIDNAEAAGSVIRERAIARKCLVGIWGAGSCHAREHARYRRGGWEGISSYRH